MNTNNQNFSCVGFLIMLITFPIFFVSFVLLGMKSKNDLSMVILFKVLF